MGKLVYYIATTLDGYIAGPGGEYEFFPYPPDLAAVLTERFPETVPTAMREQAGVADAPNRRFGTVLMGRATYQVGPASPYAHLAQVVFSRTLPPVDDVEVVATDPVAYVSELKQRTTQDIWLCGGAQLAGALHPEIDEMIIKRYPVVAGAGLPIIGGTFSPAAFTVTDRQLFDSGADITTCVRA